jgi:Zn-dependent peptidase ImmA (M78 family)
LGFDPISNVTGKLEENFISVVEVGACGKFDGISAVAYDNHDVKAAAIVTRQWVPGELQRFNIARELGHLVLDIPDDVDEQKAAFRFGAAFLVPGENLLQKVGSKRSFLQVEELLLLKKQFGISLHALLFRLKDLNIINESYYKYWCREINSLGWRKQEPFEFPPEESQWLRHNILRLLAEGLINLDDANAALGKAITFTQPLDVLERRAFRKLSLEKRRQLLTEQADKAVKHCKKDLEQYQEYRSRYY